MSIVNTTLTNAFPSADGAGYQLPGNTAFANALPPAAADAISYGPVFGYSGSAGFDGGYGGYGGYGGASSGSSGLGGYGGIMNGFVSLISNALSSLWSMFGGSSGTGNASGGTWPGTTGDAQPQTFFSSATAHSTGDPHDGFDGTTGRGTTLSDTWDDMNARPDLLNSNSFAGGYRVSTTSTTPQANGVTYNASATVTTDGGETAVTMRPDGSYAVTDCGRNVTLTQGRTVSLDPSESVTLNSDGSLTVADTNARGGSITTKLASNGSGVDVNSTASNVDLGGYLVGRSGAGASPVRTPLPVLPESPFGTFTAQTSAPYSSLTDLSQLLQNGVAEL